MRKIEILTTGQGFGNGTAIAIDGEPLQNVKSIEVLIEAGELTRLTVTQYAKNEKGFLVQTYNDREKGLVGVVQEFSVSGSMQLVGVLLSKWSQVLL